MLTICRVGIGLLDVAGVLLLSIFSARALSEDTALTTRLPGALGGFGSASLSPLSYLGFALALLILKSAISFILTVKLSKVLNRKCTEVITVQTKRLARVEKDEIDHYPTQRLHYLLTAGIRAMTVGIYAPLSTILSESALIIFFTLFLLLTNVVASLLSILILGTASIVLYKYLGSRQYRLGQLSGSAAIQSISLFQESIHGYKELSVSGSLTTHLTKFVTREGELSEILSKQTFLGTLPRHVLESVVMLSLGCIAIVSALGTSNYDSLLMITVFAATTARILPSLLPLQASFSELQTNLGRAEDLEQLLHILKDSMEVGAPDIGIGKIPVVHASDEPHLKVDNVWYRYPLATTDALESITFTLTGSGWFAIDGPSGSGKTTVFDLLMGIRVPTVGIVTLNGLDPRTFLRTNHGYCAYLPQSITVTNSTIAENVAFGKPKETIDEGRIRQLLEQVGLGSVIQRSPLGIWEPIGELAHAISGGQLQRLGIARCLYAEPKVLLLDESTTALDTAAQKQVLDLISELSKTIMVISISHDRNIVKRADVTLVLNEGKLAKRS